MFDEGARLYRVRSQNVSTLWDRTDCVDGFKQALPTEFVPLHNLGVSPKLAHFFLGKTMHFFIRILIHWNHGVPPIKKKFISF